MTHIYIYYKYDICLTLRLSTLVTPKREKARHESQIKKEKERKKGRKTKGNKEAS